MGQANMLTEMRLGDFLEHFTVRIVAHPASGEWESSGTGFYFNFGAEGGLTRPAIITNRHVVEGAAELSFRFNLHPDDAANREGFLIRVTDPWATILPHPDPDVDLVVIMVGPLFAAMKDKFGVMPSAAFANASHIPDEAQLASFDAVQEVVMVGYPLGLYDPVNNAAIVRKGVTASPLRNRYYGRDEFLVDLPVFEGSSGSPILVVNEGTYFDAGRVVLNGRRVYILGVLFAGYETTKEGDIVARPAPTSRQQVNMKFGVNLGLCLRSSRISEMRTVIDAWAEEIGRRD